MPDVYDDIWNRWRENAAIETAALAEANAADEPAHLELVVTRLPALDPANGTPLDVVETALAPRHERPTRREATVGNLLDFEREHPGKADSARKAPLIRDYFDLTPVKYVDALIRAAATRDALEHDAITTYAIRQKILAGSLRRARMILGRES